MRATPRPECLGRAVIDAQTRKSIEETGLLDLSFGEIPAGCASIASDHESPAIVLIAPSGRIANLLVQDYFGDEPDREIGFPFGTLEIRDDGETITVMLHGAR